VKERMRKLEIERIGTVEDLPTDESLGWTIDGSTDNVKDTLSAEGFTDSDLEDFESFLVNTESGDYTQIYGITNTIPYNWKDAYRFKVNGVYL
jgi:hypothetical protein